MTFYPSFEVQECKTVPYPHLHFHKNELEICAYEAEVSDNPIECDDFACHEVYRCICGDCLLCGGPYFKFEEDKT